MKLISSNIAAPRGHASAIAQTVQARVAAERERRRVRRNMRKLAHLPDHLLRDVGLEHFITQRGPEIHAFWR